MTDTLHHDLASALSKLHQQFQNDPESLHFSVALVFSSIFNKHHLACTIVGGQSAAYWMRTPASTDVDFVSPVSHSIAVILEKCGFIRSSGRSYRYQHTTTGVLIEFVGETIAIAAISTPETVEVSPSDIDDPLVRSLMPGPAEIIDPILIFVNYVEATSEESIWHDFENEGALAVERAQALYVLYKDYITEGLRALFQAGEITGKIMWILRERFGLSFRND